MSKRRLFGPLAVCSVALVGCGGTAPATSPAEAPAALSTPLAAPAGAAAVFARFKGATGGAAWDRVPALRSEGTLATGGLTGPILSMQDARGRSLASYQLGPLRGAEGFDGSTAWRRDPGGEVVSLDTEEARELAVTHAWLGGTAPFRPDLGGARAEAPRAERDGATSYTVVEVTPAGGRKAALWFDDATGLLHKTVTHEQGYTVTSVVDDYRRAGELLVPFHTVNDQTDAAGRTDARDRSEIMLSNVVTVATPPARDFAMPPMVASARIVTSTGSTRVPFELINNHIYAQGQIDAKDVRFLVDTGGMNLLSPASAARLGVKSEGKLATHGVGDDAPDLAMGKAGQIRLGDAVLDSPVLYITDAVDFSTLEGTAADGLVGFELFRRFRVSIDYEKRILTLTNPATFTPPANAIVLTFELADRIPKIHATLDGVPVLLDVDTGSRSALTLNGPFVAQHDLIARSHAAPLAVNGWGAGGPHRAREARLGSLVLGNVTVHDIPTDLSVGSKGGFASDAESGNLGGGVLRRFTVTFDYDAKKMYLVPNASFAEPFAYDRSGMWVPSTPAWPSTSRPTASRWTRPRSPRAGPTSSPSTCRPRPAGRTPP